MPDASPNETNPDAVWRQVRTAPEEFVRGRRTRRIVLVAGLVLAALAIPMDGPISNVLARLGDDIGGDLRREIDALQQFGAVSSLLVTAALIWCLDPGRRRRLLDLIVAFLVTGGVVQILKMAIGRPRPWLADANVFLWPWRAFPLPEADPPGVYHAWEIWNPIASDLWSMPSSHTSAAVALATFLAILYPRIRPVVVTLAAVVGLARILAEAHFLSDVIVGATAGFVCAHGAVTGWWGVRMLDLIWLRFVDRKAAPSYPEMRRAEASDKPAGEDGFGS